EAHAGVVEDGAYGRRALGNAGVLRVPEVRGEAKAGGHRAAGAAGQLRGVGAACEGLLSPAVLPCVERTDGAAFGVHVEHAVHLPGEADGGDAAAGPCAVRPPWR